MDHTPELTAATLPEFLQQHALTLLDFWAPSCAPCLAMMPLLEKIQADVCELNIAKINADREQAVAQSYLVRSLPTLVLLQRGLEVGRLQGVVGESHILGLLAPFLTTDIEQRCAEIEQQRHQRDFSQQQLDAAIAELTDALNNAPDKGEIRALLMHCYLDRFLLAGNNDDLGAAESLLQVADFSWLRSPQVQQASSRFQLLNGRHFDPADRPLYQLVARECYDQAAELLLARIEHQTDKKTESQQSLLFRLLDTLADRKRANELRRRFVQWKNRHIGR